MIVYYHKIKLTQMNNKLTSKKIAYAKLKKSIDDGIKNEKDLRTLLATETNPANIEKLTNALDLLLLSRTRCNNILNEFKLKNPGLSSLWDTKSN